MRAFQFVVLQLCLVAFTSLVQAQSCPSQPADIDVYGWSQSFDTEWFENAPFLDGLGMDQLGTGISDTHLAIASNDDISAFIGVKLRNVYAPGDNVPFVNGLYQAPTGYSPVANDDPALSDLAAWNFMVYVDLGQHTFADVDVRVYVDFDPCHANAVSSMFELNVAASMLQSNLDPAAVSQLATNQNIASNAWQVFGSPNFLDVDPLASGFYTIVLAVYDACGTPALWHEVMVSVADSFTPDANQNGIADQMELAGCTNETACNFDCNALINDGSCTFASCSGCTVTTACNYDADATTSNPSACQFPNVGEDCNGSCLSDSDGDGVCDAAEIEGCTDSEACNFLEEATEDNGSCSYPATGLDCNGICINDVNANGICDEVEISGCMLEGACNFDANATIPDNCDTSSCAGCMDSSACNYDADATIPEFSQCTYPEAYYACNGQPVNDQNGNGIPDETEILGCTDPAATNYNPLANLDNGTCESAVVGCMLPWAPLYDPNATVQGLPADAYCYGAGSAGSNGPALSALGCTDQTACNYGPSGDPSLPCDYSCFGCTNPAACDYNNSAIYPTGCSDYESCYGCTDSAAVNFDSTATIDDGSCDVQGCMNPNACNFNEDATSSDGTCDFDSCAGCMNAASCNYDEAATIPDLSCQTPSGPCETCDGDLVIDGDQDNDGVCDGNEIPGCLNAAACNYNAGATDANGSCVFATGCDYCSGETDGTGTVMGGDTNENGICDSNEIPGCTNALACNYNPSANWNDASCEFTSCAGCMDETACSYDVDATLNEPVDCSYPPAGYTDCEGEICIDVDGDGNCDIDEIPSCIGDLDAPVLELSATETEASDPSGWSEIEFHNGGTDANEFSITFYDLKGRLETGEYHVTRIYQLSDVCGNNSSAAQLIVSSSDAVGCTQPLATNFDATAINDDSSCNFDLACPGDLNEDGIIGVADLLYILTVFGDSCN